MTRRTRQGSRATEPVTPVERQWRVGVMLRACSESLTGTGLATSAGLNAYIPLLVIGLLGALHRSDHLPGGWPWMENGWVLAILAVLLAIEFVADKVPVVDHVNDVVQTVVRPTAGGLAFGAGVELGDGDGHRPGLVLHQPPVGADRRRRCDLARACTLMKAAARPVINATTAGFGAPVASTAEDVASVLMSLVAIILPVLVLVSVVLLFVAFWWMCAGERRKRRPRPGGPVPGIPPTCRVRRGRTGGRAYRASPADRSS